MTTNQKDAIWTLLWAAVLAIGILFFIGGLRAQDPGDTGLQGPPGPPGPSFTKPASERHLEQVTWDTTKHRLIAVVSEGSIRPGKRPEDCKSTEVPCETGPHYVPERLIDYEIDLQAGTVTVDKEAERFSRYEGELVWRMVDVVVRYAADSVMWFDVMQAGEAKPKEQAKR